jgi:flagellar biosynthesis protein FlhG
MTQDSAQKPRGAILAVTSGKGGVGKTNVVINLAVSLARLGHRVGILDADFGLGNIDVMLGLTPVYHLGHLLTGERQLEEIVLEGPLGVQIIPAGTGIREMTALTANQWSRLEETLKRVSRGLDFLLIDTAAGISDNVVELLMLAERVVVVTSFEPTAVVDAYAMVKIVTTASPSTDLGIVINSGRDADESALVFRQLDIASSRFLNRGLRYYGFVVHDPAVRDAVLAHRPIVDHMPQSPASRCFRILASRIAGFAPTGPGLRLADRSTPTPTPPAPVGTDPVQIGTPRCA